MKQSETSLPGSAHFDVEIGWTSPAEIEVAFIHQGGSALGTTLHVAQLANGELLAGDAPHLGDLDHDHRTLLIHPRLVDRVSLGRKEHWEAVHGDETALFLSWTDEAGTFQAVGMSVGHNDFGLGSPRLLDATAAHEFMSAHGIIAESTPVAMTENSSFGTHFTEITVAGYRGFAHERSLRLAVPNGSAGSGLSILVGANNSGKSTFIEGIEALARGRHGNGLSFPQPHRNHAVDFVELRISRSDGLSLKVASSRRGGNQAEATWHPESSRSGRFDIQVTPSRRNFNPYFGGYGSSERDWNSQATELSRTELRNNFVGRLIKVNKDPAARAVFDKLLHEIVQYQLDWTIDEVSTGQQFIKMIDPTGSWHTSEGLGDGLISLLFIVDALYDSEPGSLIAIDEPELSLHPQLVRRLRRVISRYAADRQVVIATHSPLLIDWTDVANGATVARVYKIGGHSELAQVSQSTLERIAKLAADRNTKNPHTVGVEAREAFFLDDGVILVEGQDDVAYMPRVLEDLQMMPLDNLYGWGSGGVGNIPTLAELFDELGFQRIGAIIDDDGQPGTASTLEKLKKMAPRVLVRQIPAPDIRHKEEVPSSDEVVGLLEKNNRHVRPELRERTRRALAEVAQHVAIPTVTA